MNTFAVKNLLKVFLVVFVLLAAFSLLRNNSFAANCPPGEAPNANGQCIKIYCPPGETPDESGKCVPIPPNCPQGESLNENDQCVPDPTSTPFPTETPYVVQSCPVGGTVCDTQGKNCYAFECTSSCTGSYDSNMSSSYSCGGTSTCCRVSKGDTPVTGGGTTGGLNSCSSSQYEDPLVHTCKTLKNNGSSCEAYYECLSGYCDSGNTCKTPAGAACTSPTQCGAGYLCKGGSCVRDNTSSGGGGTGSTGGTGGGQGGGEVSGGTPPVVPTVCTPGQITCKCPLADQQWICSPLTEIIPTYKQAKENALNAYPQLRTLCYHQAASTCTLPSNGPPSPTVPNCKKDKGDVDCANGINVLDFNFWKDTMRGVVVLLPGMNADFNADKKINILDFEIWRRNTSSYK
ncbi:MAG: hypothetical protein Q7S61_05005 [bacterium]|nr:hypothetical protein [bacterium]